MPPPAPLKETLLKGKVTHYLAESERWNSLLLSYADCIPPSFHRDLIASYSSWEMERTEAASMADTVFTCAWRSRRMDTALNTCRQQTQKQSSLLLPLSAYPPNTTHVCQVSKSDVGRSGKLIEAGSALAKGYNPWYLAKN